LAGADFYLSFTFDITGAACLSGRQRVSWTFRTMELILFGPGSETLLAGFDSAGVEYERWEPRPWQIMNAGFWARLTGEISWPAVSGALVFWVAARSSRKVSVTLADHKILDLEGMSAEEVEKILSSCRNIMIIDRQPPDRQTTHYEETRHPLDPP
jgi:hypothetical protein